MALAMKIIVPHVEAGTTYGRILGVRAPMKLGTVGHGAQMGKLQHKLDRQEEEVISVSGVTQHVIPAMIGSLNNA